MFCRAAARLARRPAATTSAALRHTLRRESTTAGPAAAAAAQTSTASTPLTAVPEASAAQAVAAAPADATAFLYKTVPIPGDQASSAVQPVMVGPAPHPDMVQAVSFESAADAAVVAKAPTAGGFIFSKPMALVEALLTNVHETTGMPWWLTIAVTTASVRLALLPLQVYQSKAIARMAAIKPQMDELTTQMREASKKQTDKGYNDAEKARLALSALMKHHNVSPWMSIVGALGQIPLWISFFFTMRHMVREGGGLGLDTGGVLWFTDLTARDPYFALPVICGTTFFGMVSLGDPGQAPGAPVDPKQATMKTFMKFVAVAMVPATAWYAVGVARPPALSLLVTTPCTAECGRVVMSACMQVRERRLRLLDLHQRGEHAPDGHAAAAVRAQRRRHASPAEHVPDGRAARHVTDPGGRGDADAGPEARGGARRIDAPPQLPFYNSSAERAALSACMQVALAGSAIPQARSKKRKRGKGR